MTPDDRQRLEAVASYCERMGVDDLRVVPVDDPWALAAAIRAALAAHVQPNNEFGVDYNKVIIPDWPYRVFDASEPMGPILCYCDDRQTAYRIAAALAAHVSREDREAAIQAALESGRTPHPDTHGPNAIGMERMAAHHLAAARRLLKLEDARHGED